jgi:hypothetical protein
MANLDTFFDDVIIEENLVKPPIAVLKELAQGLEKRTNGLLIGEVEQSFWNQEKIKLEFYIKAPSLNNYSYEVFNLNHDLSFYPLEIRPSNERSPLIVENQDELEAKLKTIFSSPEVKKVINGLLAQIKSTN